MVESEATPEETGLLPSIATPSKKVTRPVAVAFETMAVRPSGAPKLDGFEEVPSAIVAVSDCRLVREKVVESAPAVAVTR